MEQATDRGWRALRDGAPIPSDRSSFPPQAEFNDGGLDADDVDEFLAHLERWITAPAVARYYAASLSSSRDFTAGWPFAVLPS